MFEIIFILVLIYKKTILLLCIFQVIENSIEEISIKTIEINQQFRFFLT